MVSVRATSTRSLACVPATHHHAVPHELRLVRLNDLGDESRHALQAGHFELVFDRSLELPVVDEGHVDAREEICYDALEEGQVVLEELGDVGVAHGSDEQDVLCAGRGSEGRRLELNKTCTGRGHRQGAHR